MSGPVLTIPPPRDDDHDDVSWALRAASAQWRRAAKDDALGWVRRAAETAIEVGQVDRGKELLLLAQSLTGGSVQAIAPPPPVGALSISGRNADVQVEIDIDVNDDDIEMLEDLEDVEELDDLDELEELEDGDQFDSSADEESPSEYKAAAAEQNLSHFARQQSRGERPRLESFDDGTVLPDEEAVEDSLSEFDSVEPALAAFRKPLESDEEFDDEDEDDDADDGRLSSEVGFGEPDEPATFARSRAPSIPDLEPSPSRPPRSRSGAEGDAVESRSSTRRSSAIDLPPSMRPDPSGLDLEETEAEFGELDIDEAMVERSRSVAPAPDLGSIPAVALETALDHSTAAEYATSTNLGPSATEHDELERELGVDLSIRERGGIAGRLHRTPVPGRASARPTLSSVPVRQTSSAYEPYAMAPSADAPPTRDRSPYPPSIEPPSHPPSAPPPESMTEPEERPSTFPDVDDAPPSVDVPALSSAPSEDELDRMFDAISMPPPVQSIKMTPVLPATMDAPLPPDLLMDKGDRSSSPPSGTVRVDGIEFLAVEGFQDLTDEAAFELARSAAIVSVAPGQRLGNFGVAIVTSGALALSPEGRSAGFAAVRKGEVLYTRGTMGSGLSIVAMSIEPDTRVAVFSREALDGATIECPWVSDELSEIADDYQARCGAVLGPLGTALDDMFRPMVLEKCVVKRKSPGDIIAQAGKALDGLYILGVGSLQLLAGDGSVSGQLNSGDIVFPETLLGGSPASATVRVGRDGALVLYAARMSAHELLATCPPFIEILAGG